MDEDKKVDEEEEQAERLTTNEEFIQDIGHGCLFFCFVFFNPHCVLRGYSCMSLLRLDCAMIVLITCFVIDIATS